MTVHSAAPSTRKVHGLIHLTHLVMRFPHKSSRLTLAGVINANAFIVPKHSNLLSFSARMASSSVSSHPVARHRVRSSNVE
jgi:hypothetical protein